MDPEEVERLIEDALPEARATVEQPRGVEDEDHLAATVVSPAFEDASIVDRHSMVHEAVEEHLTEALHALEVTTYTPDEAPEAL